MNKERLLELADFIEKLPPEAFEMEDWVTQNECGTTACIAGWACLRFIGGSVAKERHIYDIDGSCINVLYSAREVLGVDDESLYYLSEWPDKFYCEYTDPDITKTRNQVAAEYIRWFVREKERSEKHE
jgi:hypothetical protein